MVFFVFQSRKKCLGFSWTCSVKMLGVFTKLFNLITINQVKEKHKIGKKRLQ